MNVDQYEQLIEQPTKGQTIVDVVPDLKTLGGGLNEGQFLISLTVFLKIFLFLLTLQQLKLQLFSFIYF